MTSPDRAELVDEAYATIAKGSQSFAAASRLFDPVTRERASLLYFWCRAADDLTDGQELGFAAQVSATPLDSVADQARLEALTWAAIDSDAPVPAPFAALRQVAREAGLPRAPIADHLAGFARDAAGWQPATADELLGYCYEVAGAVGAMMAIIMGVAAEDADTLARAADLGIAFQLANIARDIVADTAVGRCYLPADWLAAVGLTPANVALAEHAEARAVMAARLVGMARAYRASARVGAARLRFRARLAVLAADAIYGAIGEEVVQRGAGLGAARVHIGKAGKAVQLARAVARAVGPPPAGSRDRLWTKSEYLSV